MRHLSTYINLIQRFQKKKKRDVRSPKLQQLEELIVQKSSISDKEASLELYGDDTKPPQYRMLKHRLEEKLTQEVCIIASDPIHHKRYNFRILHCLSLLTIGICFQKYGYRALAIKQLEKTLTYAEKNHFTEIALIARQGLQAHYGYIHINKKRMNTLIEANTKAVKLLQAESEIRKYNTLISHLHMTKVGAYNEDEMAFLTTSKDAILDILNNHSSRGIHFLGYDLLYYYHTTIKDYVTAWQIANKGLDIANTHYPDDMQFLYRMRINMATAAFYAGDYDNAIGTYRETLQLATPGKRIWFRDHAVLFTLLIRAKRYHELPDVYLKIIEQKTLTQFPIEDEEWLIREAYLHFLIEVGRIKSNLTLPTFRLNRFLNSFILQRKDKCGANVSIIIIQILFLLLQEQYAKIIDISESLTQYTYKYLKKDETYRSNCFVKMILKMIEMGFNPIRTERHTKKLQEKLHKTQIQLDNRGNYSEIIPFEDLWDDIILSLNVIKKST